MLRVSKIVKFGENNHEVKIKAEISKKRTVEELAGRLLLPLKFNWFAPFKFES